MGVHARRPRAHHRGRPGGPQLHRRRRPRRPVELPRRHPAFHPGPRGRLRVPAGLRQRIVLGERDLPDHRLVRPHAARRTGEELRRERERVRRHPARRGHQPLHLRRRGAAGARRRRRRVPVRDRAYHVQPPPARSRRRSRRPAVASGSSTPRTSPPRRPSQRRWSRSTRAGSASCTGTRTPTSGSTTSPGAGG